MRRTYQHSVFGVISLFFAGLSLLALFIAIFLSDVSELVDPILIGAFIVMEAIIGFLGVLIGVPAFFSQSKIRVFAFIGVPVNVISLVFALYMIL